MTPDEAAAVLRRAAEIQAASHLHPELGLDVEAVHQLGSDLGLDEDAVRSALHERANTSTASAASSRKVLGLGAEVAVERHIALSPDAVQAALGLWLRRQWMQRQRSEPGRTTWRARRGPAADLRRGLDVLRTLELKGVGAVEVRADEAGGATRVRVAVSLNGARTEALIGLVALPAGVVAGSAVLFGLIAAPEALLAVPLAGAAGGAGWLGARAAVEARKRQIIETVDGVLDELTQH